MTLNREPIEIDDNVFLTEVIDVLLEDNYGFLESAVESVLETGSSVKNTDNLEEDEYFKIKNYYYSLILQKLDTLRIEK